MRLERNEESGGGGWFLNKISTARPHSGSRVIPLSATRNIVMCTSEELLLKLPLSIFDGATDSCALGCIVCLCVGGRRHHATHLASVWQDDGKQRQRPHEIPARDMVTRGSEDKHTSPRHIQALRELSALHARRNGIYLFNIDDGD